MWRDEAVITANQAPLALTKVRNDEKEKGAELNGLFFSGENEGCLKCYCSGVTDECSDARCLFLSCYQQPATK